MKAISYPFALDDFGRVISTTDSKKIFLDRIITLLSTMAGQRPMRPAYGADLVKALYESGEDESEALEMAISKAISDWIPEVELQSIRIVPSEADGTSTVEVLVTLPDATTGTVSINSVVLFPDGFTIDG